MTVSFGNQGCLKHQLHDILGQVASQPFLRRSCQSSYAWQVPLLWWSRAKVIHEDNPYAWLKL